MSDKLLGGRDAPHVGYNTDGSPITAAQFAREHHASSTPPADTSTAGEPEVGTQRMPREESDYTLGQMLEDANTKVAALREQLAQKTIECSSWSESATKFSEAVNERDLRLTEAEAALKQKDEALILADKALTTVRNAAGNTLNPYHICMEAYEAHKAVRSALAIRSDSTALKTVIEAKTAKLREALELAQKLVGDLCYGSLELYEAQRIARRIDEPIQQALAASAQAQDSPKAETLTPSTGGSREETGNV